MKGMSAFLPSLLRRVNVAAMRDISWRREERGERREEKIR
jgi:hypothetical protein